MRWKKRWERRKWEEAGREGYVRGQQRQRVGGCELPRVREADVSLGHEVVIAYTYAKVIFSSCFFSYFSLCVILFPFFFLLFSFWVFPTFSSFRIERGK